MLPGAGREWRRANPANATSPGAPPPGDVLVPIPNPPRPCCDEVAARGGLTRDPRDVGLTLHVLHAHEARLERELGEAQALLVLAEVLDPEAAEERAQVGLDRRHAQVELRGDVLVGRRARPRVAAGEGTAEGDEHAPLGVGHRGEGGDALGDLRRRGAPHAALGRAEDHARAAEAQLVALLEALAPAHPLAVDEGPVARQAVVGHRPGVADVLELGVHARDPLVPVQREVDALAAPDGQPVAVGGQPDEVLGLGAVAQQQERLALALGEDALLHLDRGGRVRVQRRAGRAGHGRDCRRYTERRC